MTIFESLFLGAVQGLTEFLPVSSSGHLALSEAILGIREEGGLSFALALHAGTVLSTIVVFRKELGQLIAGFFRFEMNPETRFILKILVSMIPLAIIGFTLRDHIEAIFEHNLLVVGIMLLLTGGLLLFASKKKEGTREIGYKEAFIIGIAQAIAVLPGLSRSGSTISTGLLLGNKRKEVARFSFLMVLIPIIGINLLDVIKGDFSADTSAEMTCLIVGFLTSFVVGMAACKWMIALVSKGNLKWFAYYCFLIGLVAVIIYA